jgi:hypothetical protein
MSIPHSVAKILDGHLTLEIESIDRLYLNLYVPGLQWVMGIVRFLRWHLGYRIASSALMKPITDRFVASIKRFAEEAKVPLIHFKKGQRKDDIAKEYVERCKGEEGVLFIGVAQEQAKVHRTQSKKLEDGRRVPSLYATTVMVNYYYFYCFDRDFGPFFIKFCSYFPYNGKLCLNGNEYLKQQLKNRGVSFKPLDNGLLYCANPRFAQQICDELSPEKIDRLLRKWLRLLPHPFTAKDRKAGYRYDLSILQAEFSLTQVLDRPVHGRFFFEEVIRENLDLGRPDQVQLIFDRRVTRKTPGRFRTRVITEGVIPTLHVDYKRSRIKQYFKELRALRTETTINNTRDFGIGKRLENLPALRRIGFEANRRLLDVERIGHDCHLAEEVFETVVQPIQVDGQRASALRFDDRRAQALFSVVVMFCFQPNGFRRRDLLAPLAELLGLKAEEMTGGQLTYDLRRLRLHGVIERVAKTHRYRLTATGLRVALFFSRTYARLLRPNVARIVPAVQGESTRIQRVFSQLDQEIERCCQEAHLAA